MEKKISEYSNKKEVHLHGGAELTKTEKFIADTIITITYFAFIIGFFILPFYMLFVILIPVMLYMIFLFLKYFVFKKKPMQLKTYDIKVNGNDVEISNYKEKVINGENEENTETNTSK